LRLPLKRFIDIVRSWKPDIIGVTSTTPTIYKAYNLVEAIKREFSDIPVVMGGQHTTFMYEEALSKGVDIVVLGEGESTANELVDTIDKDGLDPSSLKKVKGIAFRDGGEIIVTGRRELIEDLDSLPYPARHLLPMERYTLFEKPIKVIHLIASRGCPYGCIFCSTSHFWGKRVRFRSPQNVAEEIEEAVYKYHTNLLVFADDELTLSKRFIYGLIDELKERKLDVTFSCGSRVDHVDRDLLSTLYKNGCSLIYFGVESGSQETLDKIGKKIRLEQAEKAFRLVKELKGNAMGTFVIGFPWEDVDDMKRTVRFAVKLDPNYAQFTVATPYPGTVLYEVGRRDGLIEDWNWEHFTTIKPVMRGYSFTIEDVYKVLRYAYRAFYLRPKFLLREVLQGRVTTTVKTIFNAIAQWIADII
jgi:magnesium-protoporphyrin IX monomethyl ester (oxidative) cyclase